MCADTAFTARACEPALCDARLRIGSKYSLSGRDELEGFSKVNVLASYVHLHFRGNPTLAASLVTAARRDTGRGGVGMKRPALLLIFSASRFPYAAREP